MADNEPGKWRRIPKMSFSSKELAKRMKKVEGGAVKHAHHFVFKRWDNFRQARQRVALWVLSIGLIIGATGLQFWWYQQEYRTTAYAQGGTYAEAVLGPVNTLNPIFAKTSAEEAVGELLFARLLTYDATGHLNYDLAEDMSVSEDGKVYTVTMRPDAKWQDGTYIRARDVVFTVNLLKDPATHTTLTGWDDVVATEVDDITVAFSLPAAYAAFPHALRFLPILPERVLRDVSPAQLQESSFSKNPVVSGPYTLRLLQNVDAATDKKIIHLARNPEYYKGAAKLDRIQLLVYGSVDDIKRALATSEVNAASDIPVTSIEGDVGNRYTVEYTPVNNGVYALLNTASPVLSNKTVRQALQVGTNTQEIRTALGGELPALYSPFITGQVTGIPAEPEFNITRANQLLDEAGWVKEGSIRKKDGQPLSLTVVTTKNPDFEEALSVLADQWRALGVTITTTIVDPTDPAQNVVQNILQPRQYDVLLYQLSIGGDPDVYAYWHSSQASDGLNFSNYKNAISDEALSTARSPLDPTLRNAKYGTFAKQWLSDVPAIGLYQATAQYVHTSNVHAIEPTQKLISSVDRYTTVLYWSVGSQTVFTTP